MRNMFLVSSVSSWDVDTPVGGCFMSLKTGFYILVLEMSRHEVVNINHGLLVIVCWEFRYVIFDFLLGGDFVIGIYGALHMSVDMSFTST